MFFVYVGVGVYCCPYCGFHFLCHVKIKVRMGKKEGMDTENMDKKVCHDIYVADKKDQESLAAIFICKPWQLLFPSFVLS